MKLAILTTVCLLVLASAARADQSFPTFLNGQGAAGARTGTDQIPVIQGGVTKKASPSYFNTPGTLVLQPIAGDNAAAIAAALSTSNTVLLSPGYYQVCSQIEVARYTTLFGLDGPRQGIGNAVPAYPYNLQPTVIGSNGCPNGGNGSFAAADQGFLHLHDNTAIYGFGIQGQRQIGGHFAINCVNAENAAAITITNMTLVDCYYGVDRRSSVTPGDSGSISQTAIISYNTIPYVEQAGIICGTRDGGNGCADERYINNWIDVNFLDGIFIDGGVQWQIQGNRIEDGSYAVHLQNAGFGIISGNLVNREIALNITGNGGNGITNVSFIGNKMSAVDPANSQAAISIGDYCYGMLFAENIFGFNYSSVFTWVSPGTLEGSLITNNIYSTNPVVPSVDGNTASAIVNAIPGVVPTFKGNFADYGSDPVSLVGGADVSLRGWTPNASTLATRSVIDPTGFTQGARLTESATTAAHYAFSPSPMALISGNTYTTMALFSPGSSGTRNVGISASDGTNSVIGIFNPSTCAFVTTVVAGTGAAVGTPSAVSIGGGWCRGAVSFTGVSATVNRLLYLTSGSTLTYAGDGTSNVVVYGVATVDSKVPPGAVAWRP